MEEDGGITIWKGCVSAGERVNLKGFGAGVRECDETLIEKAVSDDEIWLARIIRRGTFGKLCATTSRELWGYRYEMIIKTSSAVSRKRWPPDEA